MKKNLPKPFIYAIGVSAMAAFIFFTWVRPYRAMEHCLESGGAYAPSLARCDSELTHVPPGELVGQVFIRRIDGKRLRYIQQADLPNVGFMNGHRFSLEVTDQGQGFRMVTRGQSTRGELRIQHGFDNDANAEVWELKPNQPEARPLRFLRQPQGTSNQLVQIGPDGKRLQTAGH